ncbi:MAG: extracellular solute-binding protein [Chloroflexi bacterium]|nr:extracellular solute-binding protein [Chloroflexota bacterium]MCL5950410.1 extracellular solute-binding protein [Chloroflexota bacterium]
MLARKSWFVFAVLIVLVLIAVGCAVPAAPSAPVVVTAPPVVVTATPAPAKAAPTGAGSKSINVAATWGGAERDAFLAVIDAFTAKTGIQVNYESMRNNMGAILRTRVAGGNPPDIALEPRPGEVAEFAKAGNLVDLNTFMSQADLQKAFAQPYLDLGNIGGKQYGFIFKANSKSTFWYRAADFKANGWTLPKNLTEFTALADKMVAAGKTPMATDGSSGSAWVLSDYLENTAIRRMTAQQYNNLYLTHTGIAWTDPAPKQALTDFTLFFKPGYQVGGTQGVLAGTFPNMIAQVFGPSPKAEMLYEGGFVSVLVQDVNKSIKPIDEMDFGIFPEGDAQYGDPVMGGGDMAVMFKDSPEARQFIQYIISPEAADVYAATNTISPNKQIDTKKFTNPLALKEFQQLINAKTFVFDGSDMAPSAFGGDHLFTELQKLVQNPGSVDTVATELENFAKNDYK